MSLSKYGKLSIDMLPRSTIKHLAHHCAAYPKFAGELGRDAVFFSMRSYIGDGFIRKLCVVPILTFFGILIRTPSKCINGVHHISSGVHYLKIVNGIVKSISVYVIDLFSRLHWPDECLNNHSMNKGNPSFSAPTQSNSKVWFGFFPSSLRLEDFETSALSSLGALHLPKIADFIKAFVADYRFPCHADIHVPRSDILQGGYA